MNKKSQAAKELQEQALALIHAIKKNQSSKKADKVDHTISVITEEDRGIVVCGSAHRMTGIFVELLKERPEFHTVLSDALRQYGCSNNWRL